jgi:hypothetical protein
MIGPYLNLPLWTWCYYVLRKEFVPITASWVGCPSGGRGVRE